MGVLSQQLIDYFVDATNDQKVEKAPPSLYGTVVSTGSELKVIIDGSSEPVPVESLTGVMANDRVLLEITDHTVRMKNIITGTPIYGEDEEVTGYASSVESAIEDEIPEDIVAEYNVVEYAKSNSETRVPTLGWSEKLPNLSNDEPYLWMRFVTVKGDERTVVSGSESVSTLMSGAYTFVSQHYDPAGSASDAVGTLEYALQNGTTTIDGGCIMTSSLSADTIKGGTINGVRFYQSSEMGSVEINDGEISFTDYYGQGDTFIYPAGIDTWEIVVSEASIIASTIEELYVTEMFPILDTFLMNGRITCEGVSTQGYGISTSGGNVVTSNGYLQSRAAYNDTTTSDANGRVTTTASGGIGIGSIIRHASSSRKYKRDIEPIHNSDLDPHLLYDIPVVQFIYRNGYLTGEDDKVGKPVPGFIAEDMNDIYPIACDYVEGVPEDWSVRMIVPPMLKLIQEQNARIKELEKHIYG